MSKWTDRITNHATWKQLEGIQQTLDAIRELDNLPPDAADAIPRLSAVASFITSKLSGLDPALIPLNLLDGINNNLSALGQELKNYVANKNIGHLTNANAQADAALTLAGQLNTITSIPEAEALRDALISIRRAAGQHTRYLEQELVPVKATVTQITTKTEQLEHDVATQRQQLTTLTSNYQEQFSNAQERRNTEFATDQRSREAEFTKAQTTRHEEFNALKAEHEQAFTELIERIEHEAEKHNTALENRIDALEKTLTEQATAVVGTLTDNATATIQQLENYESQAEKLLGVIGNIGITSGYQKAANEARNLARIWQVLTIMSMAFLIFIAYNAFLPIVKGEFTWESFAGRVFVTLTVGVLAAYCARQGDKYSEVEHANRRLELELQSIGPYLLPLSAEKQEELRALIAERTFGHHDPVAADQSPATVVDLFLKSKEFRELLTDAVKAAK